VPSRGGEDHRALTGCRPESGRPDTVPDQPSPRVSRRGVANQDAPRDRSPTETIEAPHSLSPLRARDIVPVDGEAPASKHLGSDDGHQAEHKKGCESLDNRRSGEVARYEISEWSAAHPGNVWPCAAIHALGRTRTVLAPGSGRPVWSHHACESVWPRHGELTARARLIPAHPRADRCAGQVSDRAPRDDGVPDSGTA
jgi:hypothetical protein